MRNLIKLTFVPVLLLMTTQTSFARVRFMPDGLPLEVQYANSSHYLNYIRYVTVPIGFHGHAIWNTHNAQSIKDNLETESVRKEIFQQMEKSTEWFEFISIDRAMKIFNQRINAVNMMKQFNLDKRYWYHGEDDDDPNINHATSTNASRWQVGSDEAHFFRQKDISKSGGTPYEAIMQLCDPPPRKTYGECQGAMQACIWWGTAQAIDATAFNSKYANLRLTMGTLDTKPKSNILLLIGSASDTNTLIPGDWVYFRNWNYASIVSDKLKKRLIKEERLQVNVEYLMSGENALYVGGGKFEGLDMGPYTVREMKLAIANEYNSDLVKVIAEYRNTGIDGHDVSPMTLDNFETRVTLESLYRIGY